MCRAEIENSEGELREHGQQEERVKRGHNECRCVKMGEKQAEAGKDGRGKKKTNAQEALYSVCSSQCRAKPALLADVSSSTLSSPPASPPFLRLLSSCYPPPLSCMAHSCSATRMKTGAGPQTQSGTSFCRIEVIWSE